MESILCAYLFIWIGGCLQNSLAVSVLDEYTKAAGYQLGKTPKILLKKKIKPDFKHFHCRGMLECLFIPFLMQIFIYLYRSVM